MVTLQELGDQIKAAREDRKLSQPQLAAAIRPPTNRSAVAHLEQGLRMGSPQVLERLCEYLQNPEQVLEAVYRTRSYNLCTLRRGVVRTRRPRRHATLPRRSCRKRRAGRDLGLYSELTTQMSRPTTHSTPFLYSMTFSRCRLSSSRGISATTGSVLPESLLKSVRRFQAEAIRVFSTFSEAYRRLNEKGRLDSCLEPLAPKSLDRYRNRQHGMLSRQSPRTVSQISATSRQLVPDRKQRNAESCLSSSYNLRPKSKHRERVPLIVFGEAATWHGIAT